MSMSLTVATGVAKTAEREKKSIATSSNASEPYGPPAIKIEENLISENETEEETIIVEEFISNATVVKTKVNIRLSPTTSNQNNILCTLQPGTRIFVYPEIFVDECCNKFLRVEIPNNEVSSYKYISKSYIILDDEEIGVNNISG